MTVSEQVKRVLQATDPKEQPPRSTRGKTSATQKAKNTRQSSERATDRSNDRAKDKTNDSAHDKADDRAAELAREKASNMAERAQLEEREKEKNGGKEPFETEGTGGPQERHPERGGGLKCAEGRDATAQECPG